jgi:hypothetical protein
MANPVINIVVIFIVISIIFIIVGALLLVLHSALINSINVCKQNISMYKDETKKLYNNPGNDKKPIIYSDRPNNTFKKMFLEPTIWIGYQNI